MQSSVAVRDTLSPIYRFSGPLPARKFHDERSIGRDFVSVRASQATATSNESRKRRPQNMEGEFFVDHRCIDCDTCRWMAPQTFTRINEKSAVFKQPSCEEERLRALQALLSCPTNSIRTEKPPRDILEVQKTFPLLINEQRIPGVYYCGYHSEKTYGATSYLIVHPEGNILVDSPKYKERLARNIEMLGGARYMFLSHKDDVGDHDKWSKRFRCDRVFHSQDVGVSTADVEMQLYGDGPWSLGRDFEIVYTPGHTKGSICLLYKPLKLLFTGDHLTSTSESELNTIDEYNWYSATVQVKSVRKLLELDFEWILPGHGRRVEFRDTQEKNSALEAFLATKEEDLLQLV
ncbi:metallo-beta-lactamase family protein [Tasmannia lanceolata]|uniref:metallo-beta-lactamase family protein n=1 Tax=Tasmannia lanceolata TaxID=3420 RepID=UPI004064BF93